MNQFPVLPKIDYSERFDALADLLDGGAFLQLSQPTGLGLVENWRQDSFLQYLTGFDEPESALLVLSNKPKGERNILFLRDKDKKIELWEGLRLGVAAAKQELAIDQAYPIETLWEKLPSLLGKSEKIYYHFGVDDKANRGFIKALNAHRTLVGRTGSSCNMAVHDNLDISGQMRIIKSKEEIEICRAAASITRNAFSKIYKFVKPEMNEKHVYGKMLQEFYAGGADMESFGTITAGGENACVLHYHSNNCQLNDGDLLLIDAGAQYGHYASDVSRTFPVGKKFSPEQKALYEVVLAAQLAAIDKATAGSDLVKIHEAALDKVVDGLIDLKLLDGTKEENIEKQTYKKFFPHNTSHWLGADAHDAGAYYQDGKPMVLRPGMYFSVEPGIYIDPLDETADKKFRGIGIRIEDDVLVTDGAPEVTTAGIAKEISEIEDLRQ